MEIHFSQDINLEIKMEFRCWAPFFFNITKDYKFELPSGCAAIRDLTFGKIDPSPSYHQYLRWSDFILPVWWIAKNMFDLIFLLKTRVWLLTVVLWISCSCPLSSSPPASCFHHFVFNVVVPPSTNVTSVLNFCSFFN